PLSSNHLVLTELSQAAFRELFGCLCTVTAGRQRGFAVRRLIALVSVAGMTVLGLVAAGAPAGAVVPGANGRIVFARCIAAPSRCFMPSRAAVWEIVAADPNDAHETVLAGPYPRGGAGRHLLCHTCP